MGRQTYTRDNLRPEVQELIERSRALKAPQPLPVETMRTFDLPGAAFFNTGAPEIALEQEIHIDTPADPLRALMFAPIAEPRGLPVVLHFHGGGYVFMLPESYARPNKEIAIDAGVIVVSVDYRLAPEHPFPAAIDDGVACYRWMREHAREIGGNPQRIAIIGESAGGGVAAATTARLLAEGDEPPAAVALSCAWLYLRNDTPSFRAFGPDDAFIDTATMNYWRDCYAPNKDQWTDPLASPVFADVSAFPPACIIVGGIDPLYDDGVTFAEKLRAAGRDVELHDYEGMTHIFWVYPQLAPLTDTMARVAAFLRRHLHGER